MFIYKSRYLTRAEVWYDDEADDIRSVDWVFYSLRSRPVPGARWRYFYNYVTDLTQSADELEARLSQQTAYKIRRARDRDRIACESCDPNDPAVLDHFEQMYNSFAAMKRLSPLTRARLNSMAAAGVLDLSVARDPNGNALVWHANYRGRHRATQLHSPSLYAGLLDSAARNLIGRANRYLFWSNILRYKEAKLKWFDFGGWYPGTTDAALLRINEFKMGFGGEVQREYECEQIVSFRGWLVLNAARLLQQAKCFRSTPNTPAAPPPPTGRQQPATATPL